MQETEWTPLLRSLIWAFNQMGGAQKKAFTYALGVDAAQFERWRGKLERNEEINLNQSTRDSIADLLAPGRDPRLKGIQWSIDRLRVALDDMEKAAEMRRRLRETVAGLIPSPEDDADVAHAARLYEGARGVTTGQPDTEKPKEDEG